MTDQTDQHPDPEKHWKNRRRMAWLALAGVFVMGGLAALGITPAESAPILQSVTWALISVVAVYSGGASVVDSVARMRK